MKNINNIYKTTINHLYVTSIDVFNFVPLKCHIYIYVYLLNINV